MAVAGRTLQKEQVAREPLDGHEEQRVEAELRLVETDEHSIEHLDEFGVARALLVEQLDGLVLIAHKILVRALEELEKLPRKQVAEPRLLLPARTHIALICHLQTAIRLSSRSKNVHWWAQRQRPVALLLVLILNLFLFSSAHHCAMRSASFLTTFCERSLMGSTERKIRFTSSSLTHRTNEFTSRNFAEICAYTRLTLRMELLAISISVHCVAFIHTHVGGVRSEWWNLKSSSLTKKNTGFVCC